MTTQPVHSSQWWTALSPVAMAILDFVLEMWLPRRVALPIAIVTVLLVLLLVGSRGSYKQLILVILLIGVAVYVVLRFLHG